MPMRVWRAMTRYVLQGGCQFALVDRRRVGGEAAERHLLDLRVFVEESFHFAHRDARGALQWECVDAGADGGESDRLQLVAEREGQTVLVAPRQQFVFVLRAAMPDGADGVDDVGGGEVVAAC